MYCIYVMTIASMKMFLRNKQALFFSLFMPLMILFIFGSMNFDKPNRISIGVVTHHPAAMTEEFVKQFHSVEALVIHEGTLDEELQELKWGGRAAVIDVPENLFPTGGGPPQLTLYINEAEPMEAGIVQSILDRFADKAALTMAGVKPLFMVKTESTRVHHFRYIEFLLPGIIAMAVMQMSVFSVAFVFAQYREKGILKRLMATPMRPYQFVTANIITRLMMSVAQAAIFVIAGMVCYHVQVAGAYWLLALCVVLGALVFLGLGFTVSGLSKSVDSVPVLANIMVFPQMFLGGVFFSGANMPSWLWPVADNLPLTFFSKALRAVMTEGAGITQIKSQLLGLAVWAVVLITLATLTFRFQDREAS